MEKQAAGYFKNYHNPRSNKLTQMTKKRAKGGGRKPASYKTRVLSVRVRTEWYWDLKQIASDFVKMKMSKLKANDLYEHSAE